jgi:hypothetical protein
VARCGVAQDERERDAEACPSQSAKFLEIKLSDVLVSSFQTGGSSDDEFPAEQLSLNFARLDFAYTVPRTGEVVQASFDFRRKASGQAALTGTARDGALAPSLGPSPSP